MKCNKQIIHCAFTVMKRHLLLCFVTLLVKTSFGKGTENSDQFEYQHDLDDMSCSNISIFSHDNNKSLIQCMALCSSNNLCAIVSFSSESRQCRGCSNLKSLVNESGVRVYKKEVCIDDQLPHDPHVMAALSIMEAKPSLCVKKILKVTNGFRLGVWYDPEFCPKGTFAVGYNLKEEPKKLFGDDSSTNSVELNCKSPDRNQQGGLVTSRGGLLGSWKSYRECSQPKVIKSFRFMIEPEHKPSVFETKDNTAVNFVGFKCGTLESNTNLENLEVPPGRGHWGQFGAWSEECDVGHGVCGLRTKVDLNGEEDGDVTSLNDMVVYCCTP